MTERKISMRCFREIHGETARRANDDDTLLWKQLFHRFNWSDEITICGDENSGIKRVLKCVLEKFNCDVDIRHLLLEYVVDESAAPTFARGRKIVSKKGANVWN